MGLEMTAPYTPSLAGTAGFSPLVLADRLLTLAQQADRAGYRDAASGLLGLMFTVLDQGEDGRV